MAFLQINYHSRVLGKATMMNVILPELDTNNNKKEGTSPFYICSTVWVMIYFPGSARLISNVCS